MRWLPPLRDQRPQRLAGDQEAALHELLVALEAAILVLDGDHVVVADGVERGDEARPAHLAEAGQARHLPADPARERAVAVEAVAAYLEILRMDVQDPRPVVVDRALVVDLEPDEMRGVEVQPEVPVRDGL